MKKVLDYVRKYQLITEGDRVIVGLSGGADSVCLLFVLLELREALDFSIAAVHINHHLRGQEALRDQMYVENLCKKWNIPLKIVDAQVLDMAKVEKIGIEEAGRKVRYRAFEAYAEEIGASKIALAHHQNDLAETMIYHLSRGTDLAGLAAIRPKRGRYIRPLLCMNRKDIEHYLQERNIEYVTDSSNLEDHYMRNRIRHHVVDYLEEQVNEHTVAHMSETSESLGELYDYLLAEAAKKLNQYGQQKENSIFLEQELFTESKILVSYVIRAAVSRLAGSLKDITRDHLSQIAALESKEVGKEIHLPYGLTAKKEYFGIWIGKNAMNDLESALCEGELTIAPPFSGTWNEYEIQCSLEPWNQQEIPEKKYTKWFDYDKIKNTLVVRFRQSGDWITVNQQGGKKKIKDYFIDQKIPRDQRDCLPLLCCGQEVLWVSGYRISEAYKVTKETNYILKVQIQGGIDHE